MNGDGDRDDADADADAGDEEMGNMVVLHEGMCTIGPKGVFGDMGWYPPLEQYLCQILGKAMASPHKELKSYKMWGVWAETAHIYINSTKFNPWNLCKGYVYEKCS